MRKCFVVAASLVFAQIGRAGAEEAHEPEHEAAAHDAGAHAHHGGRFELRVGVEAPIVDHATVGGASDTSHVFNTLELAPSVMLAYQIVPHVATIDVEVSEAVLLATKDKVDGTPRRTGTTIRLGGSYKPSPDVPVYLTALVPFHLEPSPFEVGLRVGAGLDFAALSPRAKLFVEADLDLPLAGGSGAPDAFKRQTLVLATGVLFHLP